MALDQVTSGAKEKEPCHLHQHATPAIRKFVVQVFRNIKLPVRGFPVLLEYEIVRISCETLVQLRECINNAIMAIDEMMLQNVWNGMDFRPNLCRVTQGAYIEHL